MLVLSSFLIQSKRQWQKYKNTARQSTAINACGKAGGGGGGLKLKRTVPDSVSPKLRLEPLVQSKRPLRLQQARRAMRHPRESPQVFLRLHLHLHHLRTQARVFTYNTNKLNISKPGGKGGITVVVAVHWRKNSTRTAPSQIMDEVFVVVPIDR